MKRLITLLLVPILTLTSACSGDEIQGKMKDMADAGGSMMESLGDIDVSNLASMSTDKVKEMFSGATSSIAEQLTAVKDLADAESLKEKVGPMLDKLISMKDVLGDKMPSMDSLSSAVSGLKEKFAGDSGIMGVLQPLLDKLQSLMS